MSLGEQQLELFQGLLFQAKTDLHHQRIRPDLRESLETLSQNLNAQNILQFLMIFNQQDIEEKPYFKIFSKSSFYHCYQTLMQANTLSEELLKKLLNHSQLDELCSFLHMINKTFLKQQLNNPDLIALIVNEQKLSLREDLFLFCIQHDLLTHENFLKLFSIRNIVLFLHHLIQLKEYDILTEKNFRQSLSYPRMDKLIDAFKHIEILIQKDNAQLFLDLLMNTPNINLIFQLHIKDASEKAIFCECLSPKYHAAIQKLSKSLVFNQQKNFRLKNLLSLLSLPLETLDAFIQQVEKKSKQDLEFDKSCNQPAWWSDMLKTLQLLEEKGLQELIAFILSYDKPFSIHHIVAKMLTQLEIQNFQAFMSHFAHFENLQAIEEFKKSVLSQDFPTELETFSLSVIHSPKESLPLPLQRLSQTHYMQCLSAMRSCSQINEDTVSYLLNQPIPYDFCDSLKMIADEAHHFNSAAFFMPMLAKIAEFKNHRAITALFIHLQQEKLIHEHNFENILAIVTGLDKNLNIEQIHQSFFVQFILQICALSGTHLPQNLKDKLYTVSDLSSIYQFINLLLTQKIYSKPSDYLPILDRLMRVKDHQSLLQNIKKIHAVLAPEQLGDFIFKMLTSTQYEAINQILTHIELQQSDLQNILEIFSIVPMNIQELSRFTEEYRLLNSEIIKLFANHSFTYSPAHRELQILIQSGYVDCIPSDLHIQFFKKSNLFDAQRFFKIVDRYQLIPQDEKKSFFIRILKHPCLIEINGFLTFLGNFKVDLNCSEFKDSFEVIINSPSPFDSAYLFGNLYLFGRFKFFSFQEFKDVCKNSQLLNQFLTKFPRYADLALNERVQTGIQALKPEQTQYIRNIISDLIQKDILYPDTLGGLKENLIGLLECQNLQTLHTIIKYLKPNQSLNNFIKLFQCDLEHLLAFLKVYKTLNEEVLDIFTNHQIRFNQAHPLFKKWLQKSYSNQTDFYSNLMLVELCQHINIEQFLHAIETKPDILDILKQVSVKHIQSHSQAREIDKLILQLVQKEFNLKNPELKKLLQAAIESPSPLSSMQLLYRLSPNTLRTFSLNDLKKLMQDPEKLTSVCQTLSHHVEVIQKLSTSEFYEFIFMLHQAQNPLDIFDWYSFLSEVLPLKNSEILRRISEIINHREHPLIRPILEFLKQHQALCPKILNSLMEQRSLESGLDLLQLLHQNGKLDEVTILELLGYRHKKSFLEALVKYQAFLSSRHQMAMNPEMIQHLYSIIKHARDPKSTLHYFEILYTYFQIQDLALLDILQRIHQHLKHEHFQALFKILIKNQSFSIEMINEFLGKNEVNQNFEIHLQLLKFLCDLNPRFSSHEILLILRAPQAPFLHEVLKTYKQLNHYDFELLDASVLKVREIWAPLAKFFHLAKKLNILDESLFQEIIAHKEIMFNHAGFREQFLFLQYQFITGINLRQFLKIAKDHQTDINLVNTTLLRLCAQLLNHSQNPQSTHLKSVHESASESALKLSKRYNSQLHKKEAIISSLIADIQNNRLKLDGQLVSAINDLKIKDLHFKNTVALRCIDRLNTPYYDSNIDGPSGISVTQMLTLCILGIQDGALLLCSHSEGIASLTEALFDIQRGKNDKNNTSDSDSWICEGGTFNKLAESMSCIHPDCQQRVLNMEFATQKFQRLVIHHTKEFLTQLPTPKNPKELKAFLKLIQSIKDEDSLAWPKIREFVAKELYEEYKTFFESENDLRFTSLLDFGNIVSTKELNPLLDSVQEATLLSYRRQQNQLMVAGSAEEDSDLEDEYSKTASSSAR
jgi:hypothetical protein